MEHMTKMKTGRRLRFALLSVLVACATGGIYAQGGSPCAPTADGTELVFSDTGTEARPAVAAFASGRRILVWEATSNSDDDPSGSGILGMFVDADGSPESAPFQVNTWTDDAQRVPSVAAAPDGRFVVAWESRSGPGDTDRTSIRARLFSANGTPRGADFQVNTHTPGDQTRPRAGMADNGSFVTVWESATSPGNDSSATSIQGRRYSSAGNALASQFQVNARTAGFQQDPSVASAPDGSFVVVFTSRDSAGTDTQDSIQARRYNANGGPLGPEGQVNTHIVNTQVEPKVAIDPDGSYMVVWQSLSSAESDDDGLSVQARGFTASGIGVGIDIQVNQRIDKAQRFPDVAAVGGREFVIVWESHINNVAYPETMARTMTLEQEFLGFEFPVVVNGLRPAVAGDRNGSSLIVSQAIARGATPGNIVGQTYGHPCALGEGIFECTEDANTLCLANNRFRVTANYRTAGGDSGLGKAVELTPDTGYFWFFDSANVEMVLKVLEGCPINDRFWVYAAGLTDVEVNLVVEDTTLGTTRSYSSPVGVAFDPVTDTDAFASCN